METSTYHILNGDALYERLELPAHEEVIIFRECLIDGPILASDFTQFTNLRSDFISSYFDVSQESYHKRSYPELKKIHDIPSGAEVFLWFEDDLFCQTNFWYSCHVLSQKKKVKAYLVRPDHDDWRGFGIMTSEQLNTLYSTRVLLSENQLTDLGDLWLHYASEDIDKMLSKTHKLENLVPRMKEVVLSHKDRNRDSEQSSRPEETIKKLINDGIEDFKTLFESFSKVEGIYGYGDLQVKNMYESILDKS